jgi:PAS domain S-box-containing protein
MTSTPALDRRAITATNDLQALLGGVLDLAIALSGADFGNVQLLDADGHLRIVSQRGFPQWWVDFWNEGAVANQRGCSGAALSVGERVIIEDIEQSPFFVGSPAMDIQRRADVRALQSTPLRGRAGLLLGMLSTHYRSPHRQSQATLAFLDLLAVHASALIERTRADQMVNDINAQYRAIVDTSADGFWMVSEDGRIIDANEAYARRSGYSREELLTMRIDDLEAQENTEAVREHREKVRSQGADLFETRHRAKSGETWPVEVNVGFRPEGGGRFYAFLRDISARKQAEAALRDTESRLRRAQEAGGVGVWEWLVATDENRWSNETFRLYGLAAGSVTPSYNAWLSTIHPDDRAMIDLTVRDALARAAVIECEWHTLGKERYLMARGSPQFDAEGRLVRYLGVAIDITERKKTLQALEDVRTMLAEAQRIARLGSFEFIVDTGFTVWSEEEYRIYGLDPAEPSPNFDELLARHIHPDDVEKLRLAIARMMDRHEVYELTHRIVRPDGSVRWVHNLAHPYFDQRGRLLRYFGTTQDITDRRQQQEAMDRHSELLQSLSRQQVAVQTAAAFAHELNQPLLSISAYNEVALRALAAGPSQASQLARAVEGSRKEALRAGQVLHELVDHLHNGPGDSVAFDINNLVVEVVEKTRKESTVPFPARLELEPNLPPVIGSPLQTEKALGNLLLNGVEAMEEAGVAVAAFVVAVRTHNGRRMAHVTVRDSGPGLDAEAAARIFSAFFSTKPRGLGLGLTISRALIEAQGGQLWFDPDAGPGAVFHFTIPFAHE